MLRTDGIFVYGNPLARRIESGELIVAGSREEIEIRVCTVHAIKRLGESHRRAGRTATATELDYLRWNRRQQPLLQEPPATPDANSLLLNEAEAPTREDAVLAVRRGRGLGGRRTFPTHRARRFASVVIWGSASSIALLQPRR